MEKVASEEASVQERCIKLFARTAGRNAKFLSSLLRANLSTAGNATKNTESSKQNSEKGL